MPNTLTLIASSTVGAGGTSNVDFTSIPNTYTDLCLKISAANDSVSWVDWFVQFNNNTSSYNDVVLYSNGTSTAQNTTTSSITMRTPLSTQSWINSEVYIPNYLVSANKSSSLDQGWSRNATGAGSAFTGIDAGRWANTAAITSLKITTNTNLIAQHSTFYLYGIVSS